MILADGHDRLVDHLAATQVANSDRTVLISLQFNKGFAVLSGTPHGALAQLGEHLLCKQGVIGSIPIRSTRWVGSSGG